MAIDGIILDANPLSLAFGDVTTGQTAQLLLHLTNTNQFNIITLGSLITNNPAFTIGSFSPTLNPTQSIGIVISYLAGTPGPITASLTVNSTADNTPIIIPLSGNSVAAGVQALSIDPPTWVFPDTKVGTESAIKQIVVTNKGTINVTVHTPTATPPFEYVGPVGDTVMPPGGILALDTRFKPFDIGFVSKTNGLIITSTAPSSPNNVQVSGNGILLTPAYIVVGGVEKAIAGFRERVFAFDGANSDTEQPASATRIHSFAGVGEESEILRIEIQYEDLGATTLKITATNERGQSNFDQVTFGTGSGKALYQIFDIKNVTGELITLLFERAASAGPLAIISYTARFMPRGETKRT